MSMRHYKYLKESKEIQKLDAELAALNTAVDEAIRLRSEWMDRHMVDYAEHPIGAELYNQSTGQRLGKVVEHYRYHAGRDPIYDRTMSIEYRFDNGDNTSRYGTISAVTRQQLAEHYTVLARLAHG